MDDDDFDECVFLDRGDFVGKCFRCGEPSTGSFNSEEDDYVLMRCVNCSAKTQLSLKRQDNRFYLRVCGGDNG